MPYGMAFAGTWPAEISMLESGYRQCPHCWAMIGLLIDRSIQMRQYSADCSVCCRPFEVHMTLEGEDLWVEWEARE